MKSLKSICEDNITHPLYEVSILADIDDQINAYDSSVPERIDKWIKENYNCTGLKISDSPNEDGLYEVTARNVRVKNKNITYLTNGMFEWKEVNVSFICSRCKNLLSLEGAPKEVGEDFYCSFCTSLTSLEGAPKKVGKEFSCYDCTSLKSLEGAPKIVRKNFNCNQCTALRSLKGAPQEVGRYFSCAYCTSLTSLEGAPKEVGGLFDCSECKNLSSLKGAPEKVGGDFFCSDCKTQFTEYNVKKVSDVKGKIISL